METEPKPEKKVVCEEFKQEVQPIQYNYMGIAPLTINPDDEEVCFIKYRIPRIDALQVCVNLRVLVVHYLIENQFENQLDWKNWGTWMLSPIGGVRVVRQQD